MNYRVFYVDKNEYYIRGTDDPIKWIEVGDRKSWVLTDGVNGFYHAIDQSGYIYVYVFRDHLIKEKK